jgi:hypothetical protein
VDVVASAAAGAATDPTTQATTQAAHKSVKHPTTAPVVANATASGKRVRSAPTTRPHPTTRPDDGSEIPVVITWTGRLVVEPLAVGPENPIKNGDAVVRLDGTPVIARQQDSTIYSGTLTYRTEDQAMLLTPMGPDKPIVMTDTKGSLVHTTRMDFFQPKHQAILYGASDALFPQMDDADGCGVIVHRFDEHRAGGVGRGCLRRSSAVETEFAAARVDVRYQQEGGDDESDDAASGAGGGGRADDAADGAAADVAAGEAVGGGTGDGEGA